MNITSVIKHLDDDNVAWYMCVVDGDTICVPDSSDNRHYQAIQEWVAEGNTIQEAE